MLVALSGVFLYAPTERVMGDIQRIFYFHVSVAWLALMAFAIVFVASILFLWNGREKWDTLALSAAEIGVLFTTLVLITGPLWAKPVWNTWWTWDPRLSTTLVMWFIYVAYLVLRSFSADPIRGARIAAVFGIIGFVDVPIVFMSIRWWRTIHPVVIEPKNIGLSPKMIHTLILCVVASTLLFAWLLHFRTTLERTKREVEKLRVLFHQKWE